MRNQSDNYKTWLWQVLFGVALSAALVLGYQLEKKDHIELSGFLGFAVFAILAAGVTVLCGIVRNAMPVRVIKGLEKGYTKKEYLIIWGLMSLADLIVLLGVYPGFFVYDAQTEVTEVLSRSFSTHHPLLHVLLLGGSVALFHKLTGSYNIGIFIYIICQMLFMTWVFTYILNYMKKRGAGKIFLRISGLFFGVFPTIVMYTLCSSKDGLFAAFLVLTVILILEWEDETKPARKNKKRNQIIISAVLMMLFRHNGFYAYLVFAVFILLVGIRSKESVHVKRGRLCFLFVPLVLYLFISNALAGILSAESGEHQEMLTVPLQQLSRVYNYNPEAFSYEQKATLEKYISKEGLSHYTPRISDILKSYFDNEKYEEDSGSFWKLWVDIGLDNPMSYVNAWFLTSYGYWYPGAVINVYRGNTVFTFTYEDSSYFGYEVELPGERHSFIPIIDEFYRKLSIEKFQQNIPVISLLFAPAFYFWCGLYLVLLSIERKTFKVYPFALIALVWLTVLLGPTYLVRYVIYLWYIIPVLLLHSVRQVEEL